LGVVPLVGVVYRIRIEEAAVLATVGDDYRAYASGRKRIIPFVW
jgi:protein-S-isoprenylcysteine O-methyltransferase Ste14